MHMPFKIIDISQPIKRSTACFPGDIPFDFNITASFRDNGSFNLTSLQMSPHIGTHADAPAHVLEKVEESDLAGSLPLEPFVGPCTVIDLSPCDGEITLAQLEKKLATSALYPRVLLRTHAECRFEVFDRQSAYLSKEIVDLLNHRGVKLVGIDTPSVDATDSESLQAHHALLACGMVWLENLDLSAVVEGDYFLSALPLKLMQLEAAPVRAVLLLFEPSQKGEALC